MARSRAREVRLRRGPPRDDARPSLLRLDRKTVYDYAGRGEIPCQRLGKRILFSREALALWLRSCKGSSEGT